MRFGDSLRNVPCERWRRLHRRTVNELLLSQKSHASLLHIYQCFVSIALSMLSQTHTYVHLVLMLPIIFNEGYYRVYYYVWAGYYLKNRKQTTNVLEYKANDT